jgi:hypothetical protein
LLSTPLRQSHLSALDESLYLAINHFYLSVSFKNLNKEYLICNLDDEEFDIHHSKWAEVLRPKSYPSKVIEGWGALRLEIAGFEVSFSTEPPGTQIVFESDDISPEVADKIVQEILENAESFTGQKGKIIPFQ